MSALPPKADIRQRIEHVCFVPGRDITEPLVCAEHIPQPPRARNVNGTRALQGLHSRGGICHTYAVAFATRYNDKG